MDAPVLVDKQKPMYINSVRTLYTAKSSYQERWMIGADGDKDSGNSMLIDGLDAEGGDYDCSISMKECIDFS